MLHERPWVLNAAATAKRRACDEARNQTDHLLQLSGCRADELRMVIDHARHDLFGDVEAADVGEGKTPPLPHRRMHRLQAGRMHGRSCSCLVPRPGEEDAEVT